MKAKIDKLEEPVENIVNEILNLIGTKARAKASFDKENDAVLVDIDAPEETGLLIGRKGENLNSLQTVLGMINQQKTGEWRRIVVNVGDWREKQEDYLKNLALQVAERAKETKEDQPLYNLTPSQRRIIHLELSKDEEIETESFGEGEERYLVVRLKKTS